MDPEFHPVCIGVGFSSSEVRPGDQLAVFLRFRNDGTAPAKAEYFVFIHLERPDEGCDHIRAIADHTPSIPTTAWMPGELIDDGAHILHIPESLPSGEYGIHIGVYSRDHDDLARLSDQYGGTIQVSPSAKRPEYTPPRMSTAHAAARRIVLDARILNPLELTNRHVTLRVSPQTGTWAIVDNLTGEVWHSSPEREGFAEVTLTDGRDLVTRHVASFADVSADDSVIALRYVPDLADASPIEFAMELLPDRQGIRMSYSESDEGSWRVHTVRLMDRALWATDVDRGHLVVPHRLGIMIPSWEGLPFTERFYPYQNAHTYSMAMFGVVKNDSAILVHWDDPYTILEVQRCWMDAPHVPGRGVVSASLILASTSKSVVIQTIGRGGCAEIAGAYREVARAKGYLVTRRDKMMECPGSALMAGAAALKLFVSSRVQPHTKWNSSDSVTNDIRYTFDEAAQVAEHLREDLEIDRALFVLAGWNNGAYDNKHPDILPAISECGGDEDLAACAERVKATGFLFGLHDNYQDMYRDAPSWDESYIMQLRDGSLHYGGVWAGGQAYLICSAKAIELAERPQNLPAVKSLFDPSAYFLDTMAASPPFECFAPEHPLRKQDDIRWKRELCDYARGMFGVLGTEEGQEWAVPCMDYFEGMLSQRTCDPSIHAVIPLFKMVYGDCVSIYTHQSDRATPDRPEYILDHILYAEMPVYHVGWHLYFQQPNSMASVEPAIHSIEQTGPRRFEIAYEWHVKSRVSKDFACIVHFVKPDSAEVEQPIFTNDHDLAVPSSAWTPGETVIDGPHILDVPESVDGRFGILIGLWDGERRAELIGVERTNRRYHIGNLMLSSGRIAYKPVADTSNTMFFARFDGEQSLNQTDRFIRNTYEILSPLNRITAHSPMTGHSFLTSDRKVEQTRFGDVVITVNYGGIPYHMEHALLPRYGFLIESPCYVAFHASEYCGKRFSEPTLVAVRSLDGRSLSRTSRARTYRAFGDSTVLIAGREFTAE